MKKPEKTSIVLNFEYMDFKILNFLLELEKYGKNSTINGNIYYESNFHILQENNISINILRKEEEITGFTGIDYVNYDLISKINLLTKTFLNENTNFDKIIKCEKKCNEFDIIRKSVKEIIGANTLFNKN